MTQLPSAEAGVWTEVWLSLETKLLTPGGIASPLQPPQCNLGAWYSAGHHTCVVLASCVQGSRNMALVHLCKLFIASTIVSLAWPAGNSCSLVFSLVPRKRDSFDRDAPQLHLGKTWTTILWSFSAPAGWITQAAVTGEEAVLGGQVQVFQALPYALMDCWSQQVLASCICATASPSFSSWLPGAFQWSWVSRHSGRALWGCLCGKQNHSWAWGCGWVTWSCCRGYHRLRSLLMHANDNGS